MKRFLRLKISDLRFGFWILGCGIFISACQLGVRQTIVPPVATTSAPVVVSTVQGEGPAPTLTAPPPTATLPPPSATPSVSDTPAPAASPTPDPNLGVGEIVYEDKLNGQGEWGWGYTEDGAATFSTAGGQLDAVMVKPNIGPRFSISADTLQISDQQVRLTIRPNLCFDLDEYGLMFRLGTDAAGNYQGYVFKLKCGGGARVEILRGTQAEVLLDWTASPAIVPGAPAENTLMVWMVGDQFNFYVNDTYLASLANPAFTTGFYGVYLRDRTNGGESVSFTNLVAREVKLP